jgi:hypothetical protein
MLQSPKISLLAIYEGHCFSLAKKVQNLVLVFSLPSMGVTFRAG